MAESKNREGAESEPAEPRARQQIQLIGGGLTVSLGDYTKCIEFCKGLGNSEEIRICMEGCRYVDSFTQKVFA